MGGRFVQAGRRIVTFSHVCDHVVIIGDLLETKAAAHPGVDHANATADLARRAFGRHTVTEQETRDADRRAVFRIAQRHPEHVVASAVAATHFLERAESIIEVAGSETGGIDGLFESAGAVVAQRHGVSGRGEWRGRNRRGNFRVWNGPGGSAGSAEAVVRVAFLVEDGAIGRLGLHVIELATRSKWNACARAVVNIPAAQPQRREYCFKTEARGGAFLSRV